MFCLADNMTHALSSLLQLPPVSSPISFYFRRWVRGYFSFTPFFLLLRFYPSLSIALSRWHSILSHCFSIFLFLCHHTLSLATVCLSVSLSCSYVSISLSFAQYPPLYFSILLLPFLFLSQSLYTLSLSSLLSPLLSYSVCLCFFLPTLTVFFSVTHRHFFSKLLSVSLFCFLSLLLPAIVAMSTDVLSDYQRQYTNYFYKTGINT